MARIVLPCGTEIEEPPDHTRLPDRDGVLGNNFQAHPQSNLLTDSLLPRLRELHPDGQFCIGCDSGIYWRHTDPPLAGCKAPDWYYVPNVPPMLGSTYRRSYVMWQEGVRPRLVAEYVSGDGSDERDATPLTGKFWVYEQGIAVPNYVIFDAQRRILEVYRFEGCRYRPVPANAAGRYPVEPLGIELGLWDGEYRGMNLPWLRVWDSATGQMMPTSDELAFQEKQRADTAESLIDEARAMLQEETERAENERRRAKDEAERAARLAEKLRALGVDPDA